MKRIIAAAAMAVALAPVGALAQERAGDAAIGALSGAVVLGPVGAVAGAVVGYTAGPAIAHSLGISGARPERIRGRSARSATATRQSMAGTDPMQSNAHLGAAPANTTAAAASLPIAQPKPTPAGTPPPVQALE